MDPEQFQDFVNTAFGMHKSMKNLIEIVFAISPLLALSTHGWGRNYNFHSAFLLRVSGVLDFFMAIINDRQDVYCLGQ
jgi:hypothetical protein